ncbi:MAG TPA: YdcF family protein [Anaerolineales bacterium]|nr:YdcF family protein [Anaerolineales bacterium]
MPPFEALAQLLSSLTKSLLPGSVLLLLVGVSLGVAWLLVGRGRRRGAIAFLAALTIFYWLLSLPVVPRTLDGWLGAGYEPLASAAQAAGARHVVVLGGGGVTLQGEGGSLDLPSTATGFRLLEAERLYHLLNEPVLILSGGPAGDDSAGTSESEMMKAALTARGVPEDKIWLEAVSPDTHQQAVRVGALLRERGVESFVLVTSPSHMRRALGAFADQGWRPVPSAAVERGSGEAVGPSPYLPSVEGLAHSEQTFREILALLYYRLRGWLS